MNAVGKVQDGKSMKLAERIVDALLKDLGVTFVVGREDILRDTWIKIVSDEISSVLDAVLVPVEMLEDEEDEELIDI
jgi:hypothetical protein